MPPASGFHVNYPEGQVIFDSGIATNSTVQAEYSHKWINIVDADEIPQLRAVQPRSFRVDNTNFLGGSGVYSRLSQSRIQLPTVAVETHVDGFKGYQLGGGQWVYNTVFLHILSEDGSIAKRLSSILSEQNEATIYMFDPGLMATDDKFPLDYRGSKNTGALTYPDLINPSGDGGYRYTSKVQEGKVRIFEANGDDIQELSNSLYYTTVIWKTEAILPGI
jgi:hypothetical protein